MPDATTVFQRAYRAMSIVYFAIFVAMFAVIAVALMIAKEPEKPLDRMFIVVLAFMAAMTLAVGTAIRQKLLESAEPQLKIDPNDTAAAGKWNQGTILGAASCHAVAIFGLVLAVLGAPKSVCGPLWVAAIVAMLFMRPRTIEGGAYTSGPISRN